MPGLACHNWRFCLSDLQCTEIVIGVDVWCSAQWDLTHGVMFRNNLLSSTDTQEGRLRLTEHIYFSLMPSVNLNLKSAKMHTLPRQCNLHAGKMPHYKQSTAISIVCKGNEGIQKNNRHSAPWNSLAETICGWPRKAAPSTQPPGMPPSLAVQNAGISLAPAL